MQGASGWLYPKVDESHLNPKEREDEDKKDRTNVGSTFRAMLEVVEDEVEEDGAIVGATSTPEAPIAVPATIAKVKVIHEPVPNV